MNILPAHQMSGFLDLSERINHFAPPFGGGSQEIEDQLRAFEQGLEDLKQNPYPESEEAIRCIRDMVAPITQKLAELRDQYLNAPSVQEANLLSPLSQRADQIKRGNPLSNLMQRICVFAKSVFLWVVSRFSALFSRQSPSVQEQPTHPVNTPSVLPEISEDSQEETLSNLSDTLSVLSGESDRSSSLLENSISTESLEEEPSEELQNVLTIPDNPEELQNFLIQQAWFMRLSMRPSEDQENGVRNILQKDFQNKQSTILFTREEFVKAFRELTQACLQDSSWGYLFYTTSGNTHLWTYESGQFIHLTIPDPQEGEAKVMSIDVCDNIRAAGFSAVPTPDPDTTTTIDLTLGSVRPR